MSEHKTLTLTPAQNKCRRSWYLLHRFTVVSFASAYIVTTRSPVRAIIVWGFFLSFFAIIMGDKWSITLRLAFRSATICWYQGDYQRSVRERKLKPPSLWETYNSLLLTVVVLSSTVMLSTVGRLTQRASHGLRDTFTPLHLRACLRPLDRLFLCYIYTTLHSPPLT